MLYEKYHLNLDYDKLVEECFRIEKETTEREYISNLNGGVQIHDEAWVNKFPGSYIQTELLPAIINFVSEKMGCEISIHIWLNINYQGSYNYPHEHGDCDKSGVIYVKTPKDSGNLIFTKTNEELEPEPGMIVLFDPQVWHGVSPNFSEEPRISFAFNCTKIQKK